MSKPSETKFIMYKKGERPWPDEISHISLDEVRDNLLNHIWEEIGKANTEQLIKLADSLGYDLSQIK